MVSVTTRTSDGIIGAKKKNLAQREVLVKKKIRSVRWCSESMIKLSSSFIVSGIIRIPHYSITNPQPDITEGIILI